MRKLSQIVFSFVIQIVVQACSWTQLVPLIKTGSMSQCGRTQAMQLQYSQLKASLAEKNMTLAQQIKLNKFGFNGKKTQKPIFFLLYCSPQTCKSELSVYLLSDNPQRNKWIGVQANGRQLRSLENIDRFALLTPNDFPYNLQEGIEHWILWSNKELSQQRVEMILNQIAADDYETMSYVNLPKDKSIPQIFHAQIFVRPKRNEEL